MLPAVNGKRLASGAFNQVIGELALRAQQRYPSGMQTATCRRAHAAPVASLAPTIFTQGRTQNVPFAFSAPSLRKRQNCDARSAMWWCERRGVQGKKARSAVNVQSRSTLLAASASEASQPQTSLNTREQHLQLHVAANARWLARSVARHAPRLTCSPQAQACAGGAIKRPRYARERALDATNNYQSKTSTTRTFPHMTTRK